MEKINRIYSSTLNFISDYWDFGFAIGAGGIATNGDSAYENLLATGLAATSLLYARFKDKHNK